MAPASAGGHFLDVTDTTPFSTLSVAILKSDRNAGLGPMPTSTTETVTKYQLALQQSDPRPADWSIMWEIQNQALLGGTIGSTVNLTPGSIIEW